MSRWPVWTTYAAETILAVYAVALLVDVLGGPGVLVPSANPENTFGTHWVAGLPRDAVAWAGLGLAVLGVVVLELQRRGNWRRTAAVAGFGLGGFLALVLPGQSSLDVIPGLNLLNAKRFGWPTVHLTLLCYAGLALAASSLACLRAARGACRHCGRAGGSEKGRRPGIAVTVAAALAPFGYATSRLLWAAGIPVGTTDEFLDKINAANPGHGTVILELIMAAMAITGGLLTLALLHPWTGRAVPHSLPVAMGLLCGVGLTGLGTILWPTLIRFAGGGTVHFDGTTIATTWVSHLPGLSLAVWGPLVLLATAAFHYRTRTRCRHCGLGQARPLPAVTVATPAVPDTEPPARMR